MKSFPGSYDTESEEAGTSTRTDGTVASPKTQSEVRRLPTIRYDNELFICG
jgi:hypothetical protein